jgi:ADP-ribose pyrophosphatase YjhB (NUDIX family)
VVATREYSAGGIVLRIVEGRTEVAVIKPAGRNVMALPKGHIERGETSQQTAEREIHEETGLMVACIRKLSDVKYVYRFKGKTIFKCVSFYLFQYQAGEIDHISQSMRKEVDVARWVTIEEAVAKLSYPGERDIAGKVLDELIADEVTAS